MEDGMILIKNDNYKGVCVTFPDGFQVTTNEKGEVLVTPEEWERVKSSGNLFRIAETEKEELKLPEPEIKEELKPEIIEPIKAVIPETKLVTKGKDGNFESPVEPLKPVERVKRRYVKRHGKHKRGTI